MSKSKLNIREILISALALALIAAVTTAALAGTNALTQNRIAEINEAAANEARMQVIAADSFEKKTLDADGKTVEYYEAVKGGAVVGYVFSVTSTGKSSGLVVMTGISTDGQITGVAIIEDHETAGYVDKVKKGGLLDRIAEAGTERPLKPGENIDAVSQATKTSKGVIAGVNEAVAYYNDYLKGEQG
jgi:electron transport complex protein RnfG